MNLRYFLVPPPDLSQTRLKRHDPRRDGVAGLRDRLGKEVAQSFPVIADMVGACAVANSASTVGQLPASVARMISVESTASVSTPLSGISASPAG